MELDAFTTAYVVCALWASTDNATPSGGYPLDQNYSLSDIAPRSLATMKSDCERFQRINGALLKRAYVRYHVTDGSSAEEYAGHDLWLTRNSHGCGYWDRDLRDVGDQLTAAAHRLGGSDIYVGDDGQLYV